MIENETVSRGDGPRAGLGKTDLRAMLEVADDQAYECKDGWALKRETGPTPNGNELAGRWVLRDASGRMVDFDQYRNDIAERQSLRLVARRPRSGM